MLIHFHIVCGCFHSAMAELNDYSQNWPVNRKIFITWPFRRFWSLISVPSLVKYTLMRFAIATCLKCVNLPLHPA